MAAIDRVPAPAGQSEQATDTAARAFEPVYPSLGRLKALHEEAEETARLANLLGRSLYTAMVLPLGAVAAIVFGGTVLSREIAWGVLVLIAAGAVTRAWRHTISVPFERAALRSFAQDLNAILLYAGFAWGAGAFLALSLDTPVFVTVLFSAGMCASIAALLRKPQPVFHFVAPVTMLSAAAALIRPLPGFALTAIAVALGSAAVAVAVVLVHWRSESGRELPSLPDATPA